MSQPLTPKQEHYAQLRVYNSEDTSYRAAYNCKPLANIRHALHDLRHNAAITQRIQELREETRKPHGLTRDWLVDWWLKRATYNPAELTRWIRGSCRYCHGEGHQKQWRVHEFGEALKLAELTNTPMPDIEGGFGFDSLRVPHPDCPHCHGAGRGVHDFADTSQLSPSAEAAFDGIEITKDGMKIKMADKAGAMREVAKLTGLELPEIKLIVAEVPDPVELARIAAQPGGLAARYRELMGGTG